MGRIPSRRHRVPKDSYRRLVRSGIDSGLGHSRQILDPRCRETKSLVTSKEQVAETIYKFHSIFLPFEFYLKNWRRIGTIYFSNNPYVSRDNVQRALIARAHCYFKNLPRCGRLRPALWLITSKLTWGNQNERNSGRMIAQQARARLLSLWPMRQIDKFKGETWFRLREGGGSNGGA